VLQGSWLGGRLFRVFILCRAQTVNRSMYNSLA